MDNIQEQLELKDVLHYYLPFKYDWHSEEVLITGMKDLGTGVRFFYDLTYFFTLQWEEVKPKFRRLSSMTEQEAIELTSLTVDKEDFNDVLVERTRYNDLLVKWIGPFGGEEFNATGEMFYTANQFHWLCKRGFWIYDDQFFDKGLIIGVK